MLYCINLPRTAADALEELLTKRDYRDASEVISIAVQNLLAMEMSSVPIGWATEGGLALGKAGKAKAAPARAQSGEVTATAKERRAQGAARVPPNFHRPPSNPPVADQPDAPAKQAPEVFPISQWIFGQANKILPVKVASRALANALIESPQGVEAATFARRVAVDAAELGGLLNVADKKRGVRSDESLSSGFPKGKPGTADYEKSTARFAQQFVFSRVAGGFKGLLMELLLATPLDIAGQILLTRAGLEFSNFENELLDGTPDPFPQRKLTTDEQDFLIGHISQSVPVEAFAYRTILESIEKGADTPNSLDETLRAFRGEASATESFFSSQRSGAVSRMVDLGMVQRERSGVRVRYEMTDAGTSFLSRARGR